MSISSIMIGSAADKITEILISPVQSTVEADLVGSDNLNVNKRETKPSSHYS